MIFAADGVFCRECEHSWGVRVVASEMKVAAFSRDVLPLGVAADRSAVIEGENEIAVQVIPRLNGVDYTV